jgi:hypothetical protein
LLEDDIGFHNIPRLDQERQQVGKPNNIIKKLGFSSNFKLFIGNRIKHLNFYSYYGKPIKSTA